MWATEIRATPLPLQARPPMAVSMSKPAGTDADSPTIGLLSYRYLAAADRSLVDDDCLGAFVSSHGCVGRRAATASLACAPPQP